MKKFSIAFLISTLAFVGFAQDKAPQQGDRKGPPPPRGEMGEMSKDGQRPPRPEGEMKDGQRPPRPEGEMKDGKRPPRPEGEMKDGEQRPPRPEGKDGKGGKKGGKKGDKKAPPPAQAE